MISHDREVLSGAVDSIVTLEGNGAWVHGGSYATYPQARERAPAPARRRGQALAATRSGACSRLMKTFKERAKYSSDWAKRADAAETRWRRFSETGPPPAPVVDTSIVVRMRGGDSARRVLDLRSSRHRRARVAVLRRDPLRRARRRDRSERLGQERS